MHGTAMAIRDSSHEWHRPVQTRRSPSSQPRSHGSTGSPAPGPVGASTGLWVQVPVPPVGPQAVEMHSTRGLRRVTQGFPLQQKSHCPRYPMEDKK